MSFHTFNCLVCHIMANSEKLKLSKWRNSNAKESLKRNIETTPSISIGPKKTKSIITSTNGSTQEVT